MRSIILVALNPSFKVTVLFKGEYLKTVYFRDKVTIQC